MENGPDSKADIARMLVDGVQESLESLLADPTDKTFTDFSESLDAAQITLDEEAKWNVITIIIGTLPEGLRKRVLDAIGYTGKDD